MRADSFDATRRDLGKCGGTRGGGVRIRVRITRIRYFEYLSSLELGEVSRDLASGASLRRLLFILPFTIHHHSHSTPCRRLPFDTVTHQAPHTNSNLFFLPSDTHQPQPSLSHQLCLPILHLLPRSTRPSRVCHLPLLKTNLSRAIGERVRAPPVCTISMT